MPISKEGILAVIDRAIAEGIIPAVNDAFGTRFIEILDANGNVKATIEWFKNISTLVAGDNIVAYFDDVSITTHHPRFKCAMAFTRNGQSILYMGIKYCATA